LTTGYRAPLATLERRLEALEEELERLRAPPPPGSATTKKSKKVRALERRLAALGVQLAGAGYRALTVKEVRYARYLSRLGIALIAVGILVAGFHVLNRGRVARSWVEATCSIVEVEEDVHVARYVARGKRWEFSASGHESQRALSCWVPEPPLNDVGRLEPPPSAVVPLTAKVSWAWLVAALSGVLMGIGIIFAARGEAANRRSGLLAPDDFSSSSD
jgi:hypothetical protein